MYRDNYKGNYRNDYENTNFDRDRRCRSRDRSRMRERCTLLRRDDSSSGRSTSNSNWKSKFRYTFRVSTIRDRTRCDNGNSIESAIDQLQQLFGLQEDVLAFWFLTAGLYVNLSSRNSQGSTDPLNIDVNGTTTFLSPNIHIGGLIESVKDKEVTRLTEDQVSYIYEQVELQDVAQVDNADVDMNPNYEIKIKNLTESIWKFTRQGKHTLDTEIQLEG